MTFVLALLTFMALVGLSSAGAVDLSTVQIFAPLWLWLVASLITMAEFAFLKWMASKYGGGR